MAVIKLKMLIRKNTMKKQMEKTRDKKRNDAEEEKKV